MRRRQFLSTAAAALSLPSLGFAQSTPRSFRVGIITPAAGQWDPDTFQHALRELGYIEGQNLTLDVRDAGGRLDRLPALASAAVEADPDVIVAVNTPGTAAAIGATKTIPIVMVSVGDPIGMGFISSLARPGGNVTGVANLSGALASKRLSILKEVVSSARRVAVLYNPDDPNTAPQIQDLEGAAPVLGVELRFVPVRKPAELPDAFAALHAWPADAVLWLSGLQIALEEATLPLERQYKIPVMYIWRQFVSAGGLISYFVNRAGSFQQATVYVHKILNGEQPRDLPVEQPTKFELTINLKTARELGLTVPLSLRAAADELVE